LAVLVGVVRCHKVRILACLVLQAHPEEERILFLGGIFPSLVLLFQLCKLLLPQFIKLLDTVPAEQFVGNAAVYLGGDSLQVVSIKLQISIGKICEPENVAEPHLLEERKTFVRQHPAGCLEEVFSMTRPHPPRADMLLPDVSSVILGPPAQVVILLKKPTSHTDLLGGLK